MEILDDNQEPLTEKLLQPEDEGENLSPAVPPPQGAQPGVLKVSARSRTTSVAGAIANVVREAGRAELQSIGAGATNQAIKAIAVARGYLQGDGIDIVCIPSFTEILIEQEERTAIRLVIESR